MDEETDYHTLNFSREGHDYIFNYHSGDESVLIDSFINFANDPNLNFDYFDAASLSLRADNNLFQDSKRRIDNLF